MITDNSDGRKRQRDGTSPPLVDAQQSPSVDAQLDPDAAEGAEDRRARESACKSAREARVMETRTPPNKMNRIEGEDAVADGLCTLRRRACPSRFLEDTAEKTQEEVKHREATHSSLEALENDEAQSEVQSKVQSDDESEDEDQDNRSRSPPQDKKRKRKTIPPPFSWDTKTHKLVEIVESAKNILQGATTAAEFFSAEFGEVTVSAARTRYYATKDAQKKKQVATGYPDSPNTKKTHVQVKDATNGRYKDQIGFRGLIRTALEKQGPSTLNEVCHYIVQNATNTSDFDLTQPAGRKSARWMVTVKDMLSKHFEDTKKKRVPPSCQGSAIGHLVSTVRRKQAVYGLRAASK